MITDRQIWIYREVYSELVKKLALLGETQEGIVIAVRECLAKNYPEMSTGVYLAIAKIDMYQRMVRMGNKHDNLEWKGFWSTGQAPEHVESCPDLRCPIRSEDQEDSHLFYEVEKPADLEPLQTEFIELKLKFIQ